MARRKKDPRISDGDWLSGAAEVPRAGSAANGRLARRQWWGRKVIWAALGAVLVIPLLLLGLIGQVNTAGAGGDAATLETTTSPGRLAATAHLVGWLDADPAPLPGGKIVAWDGAQQVPVPGEPADLGPDGKPVPPRFRVEIDAFSLVDGKGRAYRAAVNVAVDPRGGAQVLSGPSLLPVVPAAADQWVNANDAWPGRRTVPPAEDVTKAVQRWAEAYASGSSDTLRLTVGDPSADRVYVPLSGVESVTTEVSSALSLDDPKDTPDADNGRPLAPRTVAARVVMNLAWLGGPRSVAGEPLAAGPVVMDVLVQRADTAAPVVVAWGGPGEGPLLKPYQNAVLADGRAPISPTDEPAEPSTSESPNPSTGASGPAPEPPAGAPAGSPPAPTGPTR